MTQLAARVLLPIFLALCAAPPVAASGVSSVQDIAPEKVEEIAEEAAEQAVEKAAIESPEDAVNALQGLADDALAWLEENGLSLAVKTAIVVAILLLFWIFSGIAGRLARRGLAKSKLGGSQLLCDFLVSMLRKGILLLGLMIAASTVGFEIGPLLAGLGVAGFVLGFALQDTLSNFAAGLMVMIYRPFDTGDFVDAGGVKGSVRAMNLVSTTICTPDNQTMIVPNSKIWGDVITNVTRQATRRVDLTFGIGYDDDIEHAEKVLASIVQAHPKVLSDPAPVIKLHTLGESSVDFVVRPWVNTSDYWDVYWDLTREVKKRFDAEGLSIPYPQRDVHLFQQKA